MTLSSVPGQAAIHRARRERRDRLRLDMLVERRVIVLEGLVVREVARARPCEDRANETGKRAAYATGRLNVLGRSFRLAVDDHHAQAIHVDADGQHVGREHDVDRARVALCPLGDVAADARGRIRL